jgi:alkanesulfonate monooxygenase SsuD/methylene tetrahydromethanopterin reductase-like flavin-dependent oxidoreductase (luciferase family)
MDVGVGLWAMRATARRPASFPGLYSDLLADARVADELGFHSLWIAEHHFWYDGWCPAPLVAASAVLGATRRLHVGTGIMLLSLYEPDDAIERVAAVHELASGRLELGVGLGYRDAEFDGFGLARRERGRRMEAGLVALARWTEERGSGPPVWVGGMADAAVRRAAAHGYGLVLPQTLTLEQVAARMSVAAEVAAEAGRPMPPVALMRHVWATDGSEARAADARAAIDATLREYTGSWFELKGRPGFDAPQALDAQVSRATGAALIGTTRQLCDDLRELAELGIELVVLHLTSDGARVALGDNMRRLAREVLPTVSGDAA